MIMNRAPTSTLYYADYASPLGILRLIATEQALQAIYFPGQDPEDYDRRFAAAQPALTAAQRQPLQPYLDWLALYFSDAHCPPPPAIDFEQLSGTPLQKRVWAELCRIPKGQTYSYTQLAEQVQRPQAVRAVASACGRNPLTVLVPCHRVIAKSGQLGGYYWGLDIKKALLAWETQANNFALQQS